MSTMEKETAVEKETSSPADTLSVRASSLANWNLCPRRAYAKDFRKELADRGYTLNQGRSNFNTLVGSCVHDLAGSLPEHKDDLVNDWFTAERERVGAEVDQSLQTKSWDHATEQAARILGKLVHHPSIQKMREKADKLLVEKFLEQRFDHVTLTGHVDLYDLEDRELVDVKCSGKSEAPRADAQLGAYSLLLTKAKKPMPREMKVIWMPVRGLKSEQPDPVDVEYDVPTAMRHAAVTASNAHRIYTDARVRARKRAERNGGDPNIRGEDLPSNPGCWACSEKWCPAHGTDFCPAYPASLKDEDEQEENDL